MTEEAANAFVELRADDVLELAGLRVSLGIGNRKGVREETLRKPAAAHYVASTALAAVG